MPRLPACSGLCRDPCRATPQSPPCLPQLCAPATSSCPQLVATEQGLSATWDPQSAVPSFPPGVTVPFDVLLTQGRLLGAAGRGIVLPPGEKNLCWRLGLGPAPLSTVAEVPLAWGGPGFGTEQGGKVGMWDSMGPSQGVGGFLRRVRGTFWRGEEAQITS